MTAPGEKLTWRQEQAIAALLSEPSITKAAKRAGLGEKTLRRWLALLSFQAAFSAARRQLMEQALSKLQQASGEAVDTLVKLLKGKHVPSRARAALAIINRTVASVEMANIGDRLDELEERARQHGHDIPRR